MHNYNQTKLYVWYIYGKLQVSCIKSSLMWYLQKEINSIKTLMQNYSKLQIPPIVFTSFSILLLNIQRGLYITYMKYITGRALHNLNSKLYTKGTHKSSF